jgi:type I restriction enzyme S subunit
MHKFEHNKKSSNIPYLSDIPSEWTVKRYKYLAEICNGLEFADIEVEEGGYPVIGSGGEFARASKYLYDKPSVLLGRKGTIDKPQYIEEPFWSVDTMFYTKIPCNISPRFLYYLSIQIRFDYYYTSTILPSMTQRDLGSEKFPVPPLPEQNAIAAFLDEKRSIIDSIIKDMNEQIDILNQYKKAIITETITKGLDKNAPMKDSGIEWIGKIPAHWEIKRLKYLMRNPLQYGANETGEPFEENEIRYIRITDITLDNKLKDEDKLSLPLKTAKPYLLQDGDILFARSGATVGKTFLYRSDYGISAFAGYMIKADCDRNKYLPLFVYYSTLSASYEQWLQLVFTQATIQNIGANKYENLYITCPFVDEQQEIITYLDSKCAEIAQLISEKQESIRTMQEYKKSLIYEYTTGKKRVRGFA